MTPCLGKDMKEACTFGPVLSLAVVGLGAEVWARQVLRPGLGRAGQLDSPGSGC